MTAMLGRQHNLEDQSSSEASVSAAGTRAGKTTSTVALNDDSIADDSIAQSIARMSSPTGVEEKLAKARALQLSAAPTLRVRDTDSVCDVSFLVGDVPKFKCGASSEPEARNELAAVVTLLRVELEKSQPSFSEVVSLLGRLTARRGIQFSYPPRQPPGDLYMQLADWLPAGELRAQLHQGVIQSQMGMEKLGGNLENGLAALISRGDSVYFLIRGRTSSDVVAVQVVQSAEVGYLVCAVDGLCNSWSWEALPNTRVSLQRIADLLVDLSHSDSEHSSSLFMLGTPTAQLHSLWKRSPAHMSAARHVGRFATELRAALLEEPTHLLSEPALVASGAMNSLSRGGRVVVRTDAYQRTIAGVFGQDGLVELLISTGNRDWFKRDRWVQLLGAQDCRSISIPQAVRVAYDALRGSTESLGGKAVRRVDIDGFGTSLAERAVEWCQSLGRKLPIWRHADRGTPSTKGDVGMPA